MSVKVVLHKGRNTIEFQIPISPATGLDEMAFIYLLECGFAGDCTDARTVEVPYNGEALIKCYSFDLEFPDLPSFDTARVHCNRNITEDGRIAPDYVGALDRVDPLRMAAIKLRERAKAA